MENSLNICFTGHRPEKLGGYDWNSPANKEIIHTIRDVVITIIKDEYPAVKVFNFYFGGALGVDQMAFEVVDGIRKHKKSDDLTINLILAVPFKHQPDKWSKEDKARWQSQCERANEVVYVDTCDGYRVPGLTGAYNRAKLFKRNEYMVDHSNLVIAVWDCVSRQGGGTCSCVKYAKEQGTTVLSIDVKDILEEKAA